MGDLTRVEIERDVLEMAAQRAAEEGLSVSAYLSQLLRRNFERSPGEESILAYDHVDSNEGFNLDREPGEDDASYARRAAFYKNLFGRD
jgi:hypothetical protein